MPRAARLDEVAIPEPKKEHALPKGLVYMTWHGEDYVCISQDKRVTLCGKPKPAVGVLITADPFHKPRCRKCLELANIPELPDESEVFRGFDAQEAEAKIAASPVKPPAPKLPPGFLNSKGG